MQIYVLLIYLSSFIVLAILCLVIGLSVSRKNMNNGICLSTQSVPTELKDIIFVSFAGGDKIHYLNQTLQHENNIKYNQEMFKNYHYLTEADLNTFVEYTQGVDPRLRTAKRGFGYWTWKSFLIYEMMKIYPDNTLIVYLDAGAHFKDNIHPLLNVFHNTTITRMFLENTHDNTVFTKCEPIYAVLGKDNKREIDKFYASVQLDASFICLVNNDSNRRFVNSWFELCKNYNYVSDVNSIGCKELDTFRQHRHDQSLLSLLVFKDVTNSNTKIMTRTEKAKYIDHHNRRIV
jgi:hypothetical protein